MQNSRGVIILAAGLGKRMKSSLPKVIHEIGGQPLLFCILDAIVESAPGASVALVVGHGREQVEAAVRGEARYAKLDVSFIHQAEQKGTGHAARCAMDSKWGERMIAAKASVLVLPGDLPLIPAALVRLMLQPLARAEALRLLTCELPDPTGYGRVVRRGKKGPVLKIVEEKDASVRERQIREVAASIYLFQAAFLRFGLHKLSTKNAQGEYYLTDLVAQASRAKNRINVLNWLHPEDLRGVNDQWELAQARQILNRRIVRKWAIEGVKFIAPEHTWVDAAARLAEGVTVFPGALVMGKSQVAAGAVIGPHAVLKDADIAENVNVKAGTVIESSSVQAGAQIGPYAHLRPESKVGAKAKIGNFVELKKSEIGEGTSVAHLSYVGDAQVGRHVNIGCGFVTCNFDGRVVNGQRKHPTVIEDDVFVGSDCQTVAPVRLGKGAYVASGSTITEDVEPDALAIARSRQVNKAGYARKLRGK